MTLPLNSRLSALYDTNGTQKDFGFGFRVFFDPDNGGYGLEVRRQTADGYEVIPKSDYLVLPVEDNSAGVVRFSVAPSAGQQIYIAGKTPTIQQLVLTNFGRYSAESIETQFDFITAIIQEWLSALGEETRQRISGDKITIDRANELFDEWKDWAESSVPDLADVFIDEKMEELQQEWINAINQITAGEIPALAVPTSNGDNQQQINDSVGADWYLKPFGYSVGDRARLLNGDIVKSIIPNNTINPNLDMAGWVNPEEDQRKINDRRYVSPFDFGYVGGDDDYGYYLQLAIDSGKNVVGSYSPIKVKSYTPAFISKNGQSVDLSMIQEVEWLGTSNIYNTTGNRSIGVLNIRPAATVVSKEDFTSVLSDSITVTAMPAMDSNLITVESHNYTVGDFLLFELSYPTGTGIPYKVGTVTSVTDTTILTDYFFGYVPTTLSIYKINNYVSGVTLQAPLEIIDNSEAVGAIRMVSGIGVLYAKDCEIYASNLKNGAYPSLVYVRSSHCNDYNAKATQPRLWAGGQGYTTQVNSSTYIENYNPVCIQGRHVIDWTSSAFSKCHFPEAYSMRQIAVSTHGQYEHDCEYINAQVDDCANTPGGRAVTIANSGVEFGERSKRIVGRGGYLKGAIFQNIFCESCDLVDGITFETVSDSYVGPGSDLNLTCNFLGANKINIQGSSTATGNVLVRDSKLYDVDLRAGVVDFTLDGGSTVRNITTSTSAKPRNVTIGGDTLYTPSYSPQYDVVDSVVFTGNAKVQGVAINTNVVVGTKRLTVDSSVSFLGSTGLVSRATESFRFRGRMIQPVAGKTGQLLRQAVACKLVDWSNCHVEAFASSVASLSVPSATIDNLICVGSYIEGTTDIPTSTSINKAMVCNNLVKDDAALRAATPSGSKIFLNNV